jgi:hypothetical protein
MFGPVCANYGGHQATWGEVENANCAGDPTRMAEFAEFAKCPGENLRGGGDAERAASWGESSDIATIRNKNVQVAISAAWRTRRASPMALRPDLAAGLPLSICSAELVRRRTACNFAPGKNLYVANRPASKSFNAACRNSWRRKAGRQVEIELG